MLKKFLLVLPRHAQEVIKRDVGAQSSPATRLQSLLFLQKNIDGVGSCDPSLARIVQPRIEIWQPQLLGEWIHQWQSTGRMVSVCRDGSYAHCQGVWSAREGTRAEHRRLCAGASPRLWNVWPRYRLDFLAGEAVSTLGSDNEYRLQPCSHRKSRGRSGCIAAAAELSSLGRRQGWSAADTALHALRMRRVVAVRNQNFSNATTLAGNYILLSLSLSHCRRCNSYDLLVDKGTLDALCFSTADDLVGYLSSIRRCLLAKSVESALPPLLVHFTDDPPEVRMELLNAAFGNGITSGAEANGDEGGEAMGADEARGRWRVACAAVEHGENGEMSDEQGFSYYRYTVHHEPG